MTDPAQPDLLAPDADRLLKNLINFFSHVWSTSHMAASTAAIVALWEGIPHSVAIQGPPQKYPQTEAGG